MRRSFLSKQVHKNFSRHDCCEQRKTLILSIFFVPLSVFTLVLLLSFQASQDSSGLDGLELLFLLSSQLVILICVLKNWKMSQNLPEESETFRQQWSWTLPLAWFHWAIYFFTLVRFILSQGSLAISWASLLDA